MLRNDQKKPTTELTNGFKTILESEVISVAEENIAPYTLPAEVFLFVPGPEVVNCLFKNGDRERKIYCNTEPSETEQKQLRKLQQDAKAAGAEFFPSISVMASRFLSRSRGDYAKAIKLMKDTQAWRAQYFGSGPICDNDMLEDLQLGIIYFSGRDKDFRPAIVVRPQRIPNLWYKEKRTDKLIRVLIFCMEYMIRYMVVPGKVENNCVIIDLQDISIGPASIGSLKEIYSVMSHHYIGRVFRFYICNLSPALKRIGGMVTSLLTDRQKQKLVFVDNVAELRKEFALHQLEEDLGGNRPPIKVFYPFPLQGGPFEVGKERAADGETFAGAHVLLTSEGARGRLWDQNQSREKNLELDYTPEAFDYLEKFDLPIPPECFKARKRAASENGHATATVVDDYNAPEVGPEADSRPTEGEINSEGMKSLDGFGVIGQDKAYIAVDEDCRSADEQPVVQGEDISVRMTGILGCRPCLQGATR